MRSLQAYPRHSNIQHAVRYTELGRTGSAILAEADMHKSEANRIARPVRVARGEARAADLAAIVAELRAAGASLQAIAASLNERGIPTARGVGGWRAGQVRRACWRGYRVSARSVRCAQRRGRPSPSYGRPARVCRPLPIHSTNGASPPQPVSANGERRRFGACWHGYRVAPTDKRQATRIARAARVARRPAWHHSLLRTA